MDFRTTCIIPRDISTPQITEGCEVSRITEISPTATGVRVQLTSWRADPGDCIAAVFLDDDHNAAYVLINHHAQQEIRLESSSSIVPFCDRKPRKVTLRFGSGDSKVAHLTDLIFEPVIPGKPL